MAAVFSTNGQDSSKMWYCMESEYNELNLTVEGGVAVTKLLQTSCGFHTESIKSTFLNLVDGEVSHLKASIITTA